MGKIYENLKVPEHRFFFHINEKKLLKACRRSFEQSPFY